MDERTTKILERAHAALDRRDDDAAFDAQYVEKEYWTAPSPAWTPPSLGTNSPQPDDLTEAQRSAAWMKYVDDAIDSRIGELVDVLGEEVGASQKRHERQLKALRDELLKAIEAFEAVMDRHDAQERAGNGGNVMRLHAGGRDG